VRASARLIAITALVAALAAPSSAAAWKYVFQDFFDTQGGAIAAGRAVAKKCGPGGKLGTYDYRSFVGSSSQAGELEYEILAKMSVREEFRRLQQVEVSSNSTGSFDPQIVQQGADALLDFHETVFTRFKDKPGKHDKLLVRHGSLVIFGNEVVAPDEAKRKFEPKPGC
jgi:hypothetical protein